MTQQTCAQRWAQSYQDRISDLRDIPTLPTAQAIQRLAESSLSLGYVRANTYEGQKRGYHCWQLSWGGPSEEFRIYAPRIRRPAVIEYWYLDWYDGHGVPIEGTDRELLLDIWKRYLSPAAPHRRELVRQMGG